MMARAAFKCVEFVLPGPESLNGPRLGTNLRDNLHDRGAAGFEIG